MALRFGFLQEQMTKFHKETKKLFTTTRTVSNTGRIRNSFGGNVPTRGRKCLQKFPCRAGSSVICIVRQNWQQQMSQKSSFLSSITSLFYLGRGVSWRILLATSTLMNNCYLFYLSFIHFALKPVFASRNVRCFLRLVKNDFLRILRCPQQNAQKFFA